MHSTARALAILGLASTIAACSSTSSGSTVPGGPNSTSTVVTVTNSSNSRLDDLSLILSTGVGAGGPTGIIDTERTNSIGEVKFENLPLSGQLCVYTALTVDGHFYKASHCGDPFPANVSLKLPFKT